jgi:hypothetical protein
MDEKIENEDSITTTLKLRMMKHLGKGNPKPRDVQRAYKTVKK